MSPEISIFAQYYGPEDFVDRFATQPDGAVDVVIPVMHSNELWRKNLISIYREIPVNRLLLGDGGCVDRTLDIAREFPRVEVLDHRSFVSLGYSIRKLIEAVETEWFVYLHSDVYLPDGWFERMRSYQGRFDWYECRQHLTIMLDWLPELEPDYRPLSGSQMGRKAAFREVLPRIDDDYLYRYEDVIIAQLVEREGHRYGVVEDTFHYHQHMRKKAKFERKVQVSFAVEESREELVRSANMQARAIAKYMTPTPRWRGVLQSYVRQLESLGETTEAEFEAWIATVNPAWLPERPVAPSPPDPPPPIDLPQLPTVQPASVNTPQALPLDDRRAMLAHHWGFVRSHLDVLRTHTRAVLSHSWSCLFYIILPVVRLFRGQKNRMERP